MGDNMYYGASHLIMKKAEVLRLNTTPAETAMWDYLKRNDWNLKFRRQHAIEKYVADFYCHSIKLVIELDGSVHNNEDIKINDAAREMRIKEFGITVLRFPNEAVFKNLPQIIKEIGETVNLLQQKFHLPHLGTPLGDGGKNEINSQQNRPPLHRGTPLGDGGKKEALSVIKIGGNIIDDETKLSSFLKDYAGIEGKKILVHGGGKLATRIAEAMGIQQQMIDGRRITDAETLKVVTMVYAGYINKNIVAQLQAQGCNAIGLCGADGNVIQSHKRSTNSPLGIGGIGYGFAGDVDTINSNLLQTLLDNGFSVVLSPITHNKEGQLLNTNADTIAQETAKALGSLYDVSLIYSFEKSGVLLDANDDATVIPTINPCYYEQLKAGQKIFAGMIPKLDNAFAALSSGVSKVIIGKAEQLQNLLTGTSGTTITQH